MDKAPVLALAAALTFGACALPDQAQAVPPEPGKAMDATEARHGALGADTLAGSLRRALHSGTIADLDRDGLVSREEAMRYLSARFERMDADLDDVLGEAEFVRRGPQLGKRGMRAAPLARSRDSGFEAADVDGDGTLSPEEFLQAALLRRAAAGRPAGGEDARSATFGSLDVDGDGRLSRDDFLALGSARFAASDPDGDGHVPIWRFLAVLRF